ncbi:ion transporter [Parendozoicomonas haliclonae]|uniref:Ion transport protein n=1 Tax=Parendozoicomonas haliclonae TaxID=1960125 RepID=A0A1X7AG81_9GAMM|nr:ion transporter [Parendozoicomonas haliclonae]SMA39420.1 Ion transport protein [Parendozoicomonas haliclonae]
MSDSSSIKRLQHSVKGGLESLFLNEKITALIIFLAVVMAFTNNLLSHESIYLFNWLLTLYFLFEAAVKINTFTWRGYISSRKNVFDFSILTGSLFLLLFPAFQTSGVIFLRIFRILALLRILRLLPNTEHVLRGLARAIVASKAILILLAVMLIFFSMLGYSLFSSYLPEYFGNPMTAMNTIFQIFTIENWGAVPEAAKELKNDNLYYTVNTFVISVLILGGFIALSLANAVFVDEMVSDNNNDIKRELLELRAENQEIKELLRQIVDKQAR